MCKEISIHNKIFVPFIKYEKIKCIVKKMAHDIYEVYKNSVPIFIGILNGVVCFFSDILKNYPGFCKIDFVRVKSYKGLSSTGKVVLLSNCSIDLQGKDVVIFDDIIDTGNTLKSVYNIFKSKHVGSIKIAALFLKKSVYQGDMNIDFVGIEIPSYFIVGYGLDFDNIGRNYIDVYQIKH